MTFDSVSQESGLSRGGIIYHFPSKTELLRAMYEHLADGWDRQLVSLLGKPYDESTAAERISAYVQAAFTPSTRDDIALLAESSIDFDGASPAQRVIERWSPRPATIAPGDEQFNLFVARLIADGLWLNSSLDTAPMTRELRAAVLDLVESLGAGTVRLQAVPQPPAKRPGSRSRRKK